MMDEEDTLIEYILTYGWFALVVVVAGVLFWKVGW
jgi:hypothetical protein